MKKTFLVSALLASGVALAATDTATLKYGYNFEEIDDTDWHMYLTNVATDAGATTATKSNGWFGYDDKTEKMDGSLFAHKLNGAYMELSDSESLGVNTTNGFSIALNLKYASSNDWRGFITFSIDNFKYQLSWGDNSVHLFKQNEAGSNVDGNSIARVTGLTKDTWYSTIISVKDGLCELALTDGDDFTESSSTTDIQSGNLTYLASGGHVTSFQTDDNIQIDNLGVYDAALSSTNLKDLAGQNIANVQTISLSVPEPATASLSLLALGALALRRRRA